MKTTPLNGKPSNFEQKLNAFAQRFLMADDTIKMTFEGVEYAAICQQNEEGTMFLTLKKRDDCLGCFRFNENKQRFEHN